ncbi:unnamed protein product [Closterium sp. NIES-54]
MTLRPSTDPQRVPLPSPPASSLPDGPDPESVSLRAASPTVTRFLATAVTDPLFESTAASALSASVSIYPPSVGGECALVTDVLEDRQEEFECFAAAVPHLVSMLLAPEGDPDAPDILTPRSYAEAIEGTYVDEVPPPGANIVSGMWIFRVKRPPGSPPVFKARYVARGFSQRQGVDFFQTFSPTPKITTLRVLLHVAAQRDYELHSLDFSTTFPQGSLHEEIWLRRPPGFTGSFPAGTQWSLRRPVYGLRQAPREWHDTLRTTLAALGFAPSTADPSLFLRTNTTLPPFYVLVYVDDLVFATADTEALAHVKSELQKRHTCTDLAPPSDESVEPSGPYPELVGCLITSGMGLVLGGRARVVLTGHADASWVDELAMQRSSQGYTFSLGSGSVSWRSTRSSSVLSSKAPRSPPVLYVDNKAMLALCQEHRLEHRTKHIALRYFLARELQQRGQLRLAYVASQANTADVFTKALQPGSTDAVTTWFEGELQGDLTLTVVTTVTQYLGLNIEDGDNAIYLSAAKDTDTIAKRFGLIPTAISTPYRYTDGNRKGSALLKPAGVRDYQRKLGCLLFAAITCRPDLSYSASQLATYLKKPEAEHMLELDRALHYLVSTPAIGLTYHKTSTATPKLIGYVDADHAGDSDNRRSRTSYVYRLEPIGPISWQSNKQELIALSSA